MTTLTTSDPTTSVPAQQHRRATAVGRVVSGLVAAFLLFDAVIHLLNIEPVRVAMTQLGYPVGHAVGIGVVELICVVLYLVPRTSVLGAVLLTGYLGGAVAAQLRVEAAVLGTLLFPVYVGIAVWAGLWLRDARVRAMLPLRRG